MCPPSLFENAADISTGAGNTKWIPKTPISQAAYEHARATLAPPILAHSIRVYLYANALARRERSDFAESSAKQDLLFVGCLFHDIGTSSNYNTSARFEVDGADAASTFLEKFNVDKSDRHDVWTAIACHTSPGIAERIGELPRLVRLGVSMDFGKATGDLKEFADKLKEPFEEKFPRAGIEQCLVDAVVGQAKEKPEKAPMVSWVGVLYLKAIGQLKWDVDAF